MTDFTDQTARLAASMK